MSPLRTALLALPLALPPTLYAPVAQAAPFASLDQIDYAVAGFTGAGIGQPRGAMLPVDRRLRLAACQAPLALSWRTERRDAVLVQCPDAGGWHVFVPVQAQAAANAAPVVLRGEAVSLIVSGDGFSVSQPGEAMDSGAVGAWIRVRTVKDGTGKGDPVRARIVRPGLAEVPVD
ncbi:MAG: flagella basal body P-ring formation protein FlgA [Sphingomonadales bacterium]|nr:flagella basal body P-ring formation protein FlgA [Sphingomonadales bacterium]